MRQCEAVGCRMRQHVEGANVGTVQIDWRIALDQKSCLQSIFYVPSAATGVGASRGDQISK